MHEKLVKNFQKNYFGKQLHLVLMEQTPHCSYNYFPNLYWRVPTYKVYYLEAFNSIKKLRLLLYLFLYLSSTNAHPYFKAFQCSTTFAAKYAEY